MSLTPKHCGKSKIWENFVIFLGRHCLLFLNDFKRESFSRDHYQHITHKMRFPSNLTLYLRYSRTSTNLLTPNKILKYHGF